MLKKKICGNLRKAAIKREKSDACISFSEREQTRPKVKSVEKTFPIKNNYFK